jgi:hypothetical protein
MKRYEVNQYIPEYDYLPEGIMIESDYGDWVSWDEAKELHAALVKACALSRELVRRLDEDEKRLRADSPDAP